MIRDSLGDRMKKYEAVTKTTLVSRMPIIIRLDGCHFHTFTRGMKKPFDPILNKTMQETMKYLCENIQGCVLGYTQSDEITLVLVDYQSLNSTGWFDNEVLKMTSVSSALATLAFNMFYSRNIADMTESEEEFKFYANKLNKAYFDSRVFNVPKEDVTNCVYWRQKDAERNSINSLAQSLFSHKSLQGLSLKDTIAKIETEKGIVWGELPTTQKRGSCCIKDTWFILDDGQKVKDRNIVTYNGKKGIIIYDTDLYFFEYLNDGTTNYKLNGLKLYTKEETKWIIDNDIPRFKDEGRQYIEKLIFVGE